MLARVWLSLVPLIGVLLAVLLLPGTLILLTARVPFHHALGTSPAVAVSVIAGAGVVCPFLGVPWGVRPVAVAFVCLEAFALILRVVARKHTPITLRDNHTHVAPWLLPSALSALLATYLTARTLNRPDAISQTYDAVHHYNAVRWILDTGNASTLHFKMNWESLDSAGGIYPLGWHTLLALTLKLTGSVDVIAVTNAGVFVTTAVIWIIGCFNLVREVVGTPWSTMLAMALLIPAVTAFPLSIVDWGTLFAFLLGVALLPAVLALLHATLRLSTEPASLGLVSALPALLLGLGGIGFAHPSLLPVAAIASVAMGAQWLRIRRTQPAARTHRRRDVIVLVTLVFAALAVFTALRISPENAHYNLPSLTEAQAIGEALTLAPGSQPIIWPVALGVLMGVWRLTQRREYPWLLATYIYFFITYVVVKSFDIGLVRDVLTSTWYSDSPRVGAILAVFAIPTLALGTDWLLRWLQRWLSAKGTHWLRLAGPTRVAVATALVVIGVLGPFSPGMDRAITILQWRYDITQDQELLSPDEVALMKRLREDLPEGAVIAVDPWTGGSMAYALSGVPTTIRHFSYARTQALTDVDEHLNEVSSRPSVCHALSQLGVKYALYLPGETMMHHQPFPGFKDLNAVEGFTLIDRQGDAALYEITACQVSR